jgi:anti-sigma factor RsiW
MRCEQSSLSLHAFLDGEVDARHTREFEAHLTLCPRCAAELRDCREIRRALSEPEMRYQAPAGLRRRIESALPQVRARAPRLRTLLEGFTMGTILSAALAASLVMFVVRSDPDQLVDAELVSAHLRSLQSGRLIDVQSSDQHTVKSWFNGRLEMSPPVIDLAAEGFTLVGGRLDYVDARPVATLVYERGTHIINVFIAEAPGRDRQGKMEAQLQGFNIWRGSWSGFACSAVSDVSPAELQEFGAKFQAAMRSAAS